MTIEGLRGNNMSDNSWQKIQDKSIYVPCNNKKSYVQGILEHWCCSYHCAEECNRFNEENSKKISKTTAWQEIKDKYPSYVESDTNYFLVYTLDEDIFVCRIFHDTTAWLINHPCDNNCVFMSNCFNHSNQCGSHTIRFDEVKYWARLSDLILPHDIIIKEPIDGKGEQNSCCLKK